MKFALTIYVIKCIFSFWEFGGLFGAMGGGLIGPPLALLGQLVSLKRSIGVFLAFFLGVLLNYWAADFKGHPLSANLRQGEKKLDQS